MTTTSIRTASKVGLEPWIKVYNEVPGDKAIFPCLTIKEVQKAIQAYGLHLDRFLVSYQSGRPAAVCRLELDKAQNVCYAVDLHVLPGLDEGGTALVDMIIQTSRMLGADSIVGIIPLNAHTTLDTLGTYLFNPGRADVLMSRGVDEHWTKVEGLGALIETYVIKSRGTRENPSSSKWPPSWPLHRLVGQLRDKWAWAFSLGNPDTGEVSLDCFISEKDRTRAWAFGHPSAEITSDMVLALLGQLSNLSRREVMAVVDTGYPSKTPFSQLGFKEESTQFQMVFDLMYCS